MCVYIYIHIHVCIYIYVCIYICKYTYKNIIQHSLYNDKPYKKTMYNYVLYICILYIYILFSTSDLYIPYNCSSLEHINKKILFKCAAQLTFLCILYVDIFVSKSAKNAMVMR